MKKIVKLFSIGLFIVVSLIACSSQSSQNLQNIKKGRVTAKIVCASDTTVSYALYLPANYDPGKKWPLIIAFDPHASGHLPVTLFSDEAEKKGFLLVGSNNSKNGMDFSEIVTICRMMLNDIESRFSVDTGCIYAIGFSGGGRIAGSVAMTEGGIAGVVSCGAGLSSSGQPPKQPFSFLGVAGTSDFNYSEVQALDPQLEQAGFTHHFLSFDGKHEWPPKQLIPEIMDWIEFDAMRTNHLPIDRNVINRFIDNNDSLASAQASLGKPYEQLQVYLKMKHYLKGLTDVSSLDSIIAQLAGDPKVIARQNETDGQMKLEGTLRDKYSSMLQNPDITYWNSESKKLKTQANKIPVNGESLVYKRVLGHLSLSAYMISNNALKKNDLALASQYVEVYRLVDPENPEHRYMAAVIAARRGNKDGAFKDLGEAIELGFSDKARVQADPDFTSYHADAHWQELVKRLK